MAIYRPRARIELALVVREDDETVLDVLPDQIIDMLLENARTEKQRQAILSRSAGGSEEIYGGGLAEGVVQSLLDDATTEAQRQSILDATSGSQPLSLDEASSLLELSETDSQREAILGALDEDLAPVVAAIPISMEWRRNSIRKADDFSFELDYSRLPIDPRALRGARITAYFWDSPDGSPPPATEETLVFIGIVDSLEAKLGSSTDTVSGKARDYTSLFLDRKVPQVETTDAKGKRIVGAKPYRIDRPFREVVLELFDDIGEAAEQIRARFEEVYPPGSFAPLDEKLSDITGRNLFLTETGWDLWSVLSRMCDILVVLPQFRFDELRIEKATETDSIPFSFRYGGNMKSLMYRRNFDASHRRAIEIRCYNPWATDVANRRLTGRYPKEIPGTQLPDLKTRNSKRSKLKTVKNDAEVNQIVGAYSQETLDELAKEAFILAYRENVQGKLETRDLVDLGLDEQALGRLQGSTFAVEMIRPRSVTQMSNGDVILLDLRRDDWDQLWSLSPREAVLALVERGLDPGSATTLVEVSRGYESKIAALYVKEATHRWDSSTGYELKLAFSANFSLDVR